jgi:hypothetical protein
MNQDELEIGGIYSNGKERESVSQITGFIRCPGDYVDINCVRYRVIKGLRPKVGKEFTITRQAFARWAHHRVVPGFDDPEMGMVGTDV